MNFSDLESLEDLALGDKNKDRPTFKCLACSGTGKWTRRCKTYGDCYACKGKGHFLTSPQSRRKAKVSRAKTAANKLRENSAAFKKSKPAIFDYLADKLLHGSDFANSLLESVAKYGDLTENQEAAVLRGIAKDEDRATAKAKSPDAELDMTSVKEKLDTAFASGIKNPILRLESFKINRAKDESKNPGHLYVKSNDGDYLGKVSPEGHFYKSYDATDNHVAAILEVGKDVLAAAVAYGKRTGSCSCCGKELTNPESIELGIGPICIQNWGF